MKCVNPEVTERVDALNQSLQKVLRKETSIISIKFNELLFPQSLTNNIFPDVMEYVFLLLVTHWLQMSYRNTLETTKHQSQRKEPDHITSTKVISIVQTIKE